MGSTAKKEKEAFTAWGERVGFLQAGLGLRPGERRAYRLGETVTLVVRARNVGTEAVEFEYLRKFFVENPPSVTDNTGEPIPQIRLDALGFHVAEDVSLPPGKEVELASVQFELLPARERGKPKARIGKFPPLYVEAGQVSLRYEQVFGNTSSGSIRVNPDLLKLATGKLELEITDDPQAEKNGDGGAAHQPQPPVPPKTYIGPEAADLGVVAAADLGRTYKANRARFDELYTDKTFHVRGTVTQVFRTKPGLASTGGEADYVVEMESDAGLPVQFLAAPKHRKALAELAVNELATIRGFCCGVRGGSFTPTGVKDGEESIHFYAVEIIGGKGVNQTTPGEEKR